VSFRKAVNQTKSIAQAYRKGLKALSADDRGRLSISDTRLLTGSVDIDSALKPTQPNAARWDYAIGWRRSSYAAERILWAEIHPVRSQANLSEIQRKLELLVAWLSNEGKKLRRFESEFICISSGETGFTMGSPQVRQLADRGLRLVGRHHKMT
jgi:hypothetical protein